MTMTINLTTIACSVVLCSALLPSPAAANCGGAIANLKPAAYLSHGRDDASWANDNGRSTFAPEERSAIVGLWKVTLTAGGTVIDVGFDAWHDDGTEILNDSSPISHNVCLGVWKQVGRRTFVLKHPAFRYGPDGSVIGTLLIRETNVVNRAGNRFTGTFTIEFFDLDGNSVFTGAGEITGERITVN
jgi:hypothetical protein